MSATQKYRYLDSPGGSARENMRRDQEMLEDFSEAFLPCFRLYSWEPSVSIGVSQDFDTLAKEDETLEVFRESYAKRMTGGGLLHHGHDLSYSLVLPTVWMRGLSVKQSYEKITAFVLRFYHDLGLEPHWAKEDESLMLSSSAYCQQGFEPYDIIIQGRKIGGNAQKRTKQAIFQHGSIPLVHNRYGVSLEDLGVILNEAEVREHLECAFREQIKRIKR